MHTLKTYIELLRPQEWHKNITILIGTVFAIILTRTSFDKSKFFLLLFVILTAILLSSTNYIINAITDRKFDRKHPSKKTRPLAAKVISPINAAIFTLFLLIITLSIAITYTDSKHTFLLMLLLIAALLYNISPIRLKDHAFIDVISESVNNPIRFTMGWIVITPTLPSIILLLLTWTAAAIFMTQKRHQELRIYKNAAQNYRKVYKTYTLQNLKKTTYLYTVLSAILTVWFILTLI